MKTKFLLPVVLLAGAFLALPLRAQSVEPPVPVRTVAPKYPNELRRDGTSGLVTVKVLIDEKGNVAEAEVEKSSNEAFKAPAVEAVRKWKFKPGKRDGEAVALRVSIPIQFSVSDSD